MTKLISTTSLFALLFTASIASAEPLAAPVDGPLKIGVLYPQTGELANMGSKSIRGALLALEEFAGEGQAINAIVEDSSEEAGAKLVSVTKKILEQNKVDIIIGPGTLNQAAVVAPLAEQAGCPLFTNALCSPESLKFPNLVCGYPSTPDQLATLPTLVSKFGIKKIAFVSDESVYRAEVLAELKLLESQGVFQIVLDETVPANSTDLRTTATKVKASGANAVFATTSNPAQTLSLFKQLSDQNFSGARIGYLDVDQKLVDEFKDVIEGILLPGYVSSKYSPEFVAKYQARYHETPDMYAPLVYDLTRIVLATLKEGGWSKENLIQRVTMHDYKNPAIPGYKIREDRSLALPTVVLTVRKGKLEEL